MINKFRGDQSLFDDGVTEIERKTGWPCFGVIPWLKAPSYLPAEDAVALSQPLLANEKAPNEKLRIAAPMLSRIANFDDADPLKLEPSIDFQWVPPGQTIPKQSDIIIIFGTKSTLGDLAFLRAQGWDHDIIAHARAGGRVLGICGGYQMLGRTIVDPHGADGLPGKVNGLGLLEIDTVMTLNKRVTPSMGACAHTGVLINGYEIHIGSTNGPDTDRPFAYIDDLPDGACSANGKVEGTYLHGAFTNDAFRRAWLDRAGTRIGENVNYGESIERALNALADGIEEAVSIEALIALAAHPGWMPPSR